jgi:DNA (cytosine-5)-methyltransferase 1
MTINLDLPLVIDLYPCEGGATSGYQTAGYRVHAVDKFGKYARRNPAEQWTTADAIAFVRNYDGPRPALWHASPPCQRYTRGNAMNDVSHHPDLIAETREVLQATGEPYVIENVADARPHLLDPITLCGTMDPFRLHADDDDGTPLEMWRHRLFETSFEFRAPSACNHGWYSNQVAGAYGGARRDKAEARNVRHGGYVPAKHVCEKLLGIDWMTQFGLFQSLPPVYTEYIGTCVRNAMRVMA